MYVLIDDGRAIRPPMGSVTLRNVAIRQNPSAKPGFAVAGRDRLEAGAEVLRVERAAPDHHGEPRDVNASSRTPGHGPISWVNPKYRKKIWTRIGVLRIIST